MDRNLSSALLLLALGLFACETTDELEDSSVPAFSAELDKSSLCANPGETFSPIVDFRVRGVGPYTYEWMFDDPDIPDSTDESPSITINEKKNVDVTVTVTDSQGRTDTVSGTIRIKDDCTPVTATIERPSENVSIVEGTWMDFDGSVTGGDGPYTYEWSFFNPQTDERLTSNAQNLTQLLPLGTWTVNLQVTDSTGDLDFADVRIVTVTEDTREEKPEYQAARNDLGEERISDIPTPGGVTRDLADHSGKYGFYVTVAPGQTVNITTETTGSVSVEYFPQHSPGFDFADAGPGSNDLTNQDDTLSNGVLVVVEGTGLATVTVSTE